MTALKVFRRELRGLLWSPQTYAIGAAYLIISGVFFVNILISSQIPDLERYYSNIANTLLVLVPIVAMRSFAEERRTGALDVTLAWPLSRNGLVLGKFAANTLYLWGLSSIVWQYHRLVGHLANIDLSRTAGGYIGLLLMAMAFSALALMVSARASSPAGAAFLGFGLLLFLWILDYVPGWLGKWLQSIGPTEHFASFPRGVVYWDDVTYFLVTTLVGLGLAVAALERERPGRIRVSVVRRGSLLGALVVLLGGTVALAGNVEGQYDLTRTKANTTTETTRDVIHRIRELGRPIRLTGFAAPISKEASLFRGLTKQYNSAGAQISLKLVDPDVEPGIARQFGVSGYGHAILELGDRRELLKAPSQGSVTSALLRLSRSSRQRVCFVAGHGERDIGDQGDSGLATLAGGLGYLGYDVKPLALGSAGADAEMQNCAAVVIAGARAPFLPQELALLDTHAKNNGRLLVMADALATEPRDQLNTLLAPWGVTFGMGIVRDASALADDPSSIVSLDFGSGSSPAVTRINEQRIPVVLTNALPIEVADDAKEEGAISELVRSSPKSWIDPGAPGTPRRKGPFVLSTVADWSRIEGTNEDPSVARTRIGVVGTAEVATNRVLEILGNRDFVTGLVQWIGQEDDVIAAGRPPSGFNKLVMTSGQKSRLIRQGIALPTLLLLLPLPLVTLRMKRG